MSLSKYITSVTGDMLLEPPTLAFFYKGVSIVSNSITKVTSTQAQVIMVNDDQTE